MQDKTLLLKARIATKCKQQVKKLRRAYGDYQYELVSVSLGSQKKPPSVGLPKTWG